MTRHVYTSHSRTMAGAASERGPPLTPSDFLYARMHVEPYPEEIPCQNKTKP